MVKLPRFLPLVLGLGVMAACQTEPAEETGTTEETAATDAAAVRTEIEGLSDRFEQALLAEDAATIGGLYAEDAVALPPGAPRAEGRAAIEALFASWFEEIPAPEGFTLTTDDLQVAGSGDIAYEVGTYTSRGTSPEGESYDETGKYLVVWKNMDGEWKIVRDIWNGDAPMHMGAEEGTAPKAPEAAAPESPEAAQPDADTPAE
ncbi:MAG TPA: SgcJ/EcaC family oxidoreductase [Gemmatimonadota bacterium]|nr:SgcJ/EcaC family oxidoreductase [Gemmatimonadota bacterium]